MQVDQVDATVAQAQVAALLHRACAALREDLLLLWCIHQWLATKWQLDGAADAMPRKEETRTTEDTSVAPAVYYRTGSGDRVEMRAICIYSKLFVHFVSTKASTRLDLM